MGRKDSHQAIQAREAFETIISQEEPKELLCKLLDKIQEKTHLEGRETEWTFKPEGLSREMHDADLESLNFTLQFLFNIKYINVNYPVLNKPINSKEYTALPHRFSSAKVEDTKRKVEVLSLQRRLRGYIQEHLPDSNILLNEEQIKEVESTLLNLKGLHEKTNQRRSYEEPTVAYFILKSKLKRNPTEIEMNEYMGLSDYRFLKDRKALSKEFGKSSLKLEFSKEPDVLFEERKNKFEQVYSRIKEQGKIPTVKRIAKEVGLGSCQARRYVKRLKLDVVDGNTATYQERVEKVKKAYEQLKGEFLPTSLEISEKTGIYLQKVTEICRDQDIKLLHQNWSGLKVMHHHLKDLMSVGVDISETANSILQDYVSTMGYYLSHNTFTKYRHMLEEMKLIPESRRKRERLVPRKYLKYQESYLELVKEKMKNKEKIVLKRIAKELSEKFNEEVPDHRVSELREATGIPVLLDNEARYRNIVRIYGKHPQMQMDDWAEEAKVSIGFLYDALRQFKKLPEIRKKFDVPDEMLGRLKTKENPMVKAFRAIGNTNRVKILKCLMEGDDITLDDILERVRYDPAKWRSTFEYHLEVLEDAGIVSLSYFNSSINLTSLGEDISSHIKKWDIDEIVPEEIFGPGYNKPLFTLAISKGDTKTLKEIVKFMREQKGRIPAEVPSEKASERHPVTDYLRHSFKKYLSSFLGKYQIKEEHLALLGPLILDVRDFFSTSHISIPHLCRIKEVDYGKVRDITFALADRGDVDEFYLQVPQEQALRYMRFIRDNFYAICERVKLQVPQKNLKLEYDRHREIYSLKLC